MNSNPKIDHPELFFGLCGPVGVDLDTVSRSIRDQLGLFGYETRDIHLTEFLKLIDSSLGERSESLSQHYDRLISSANRARERFGNRALMAQIGLFLIQEARKGITGDPLKPAHRIAYIIRQLKRPEEIELFREIYGKQVYQVSAYMDPEKRRNRLAVKMRDYDNTSTRTLDFQGEALALIRRDDNEPADEYGQRMRDVYPQADVFIDASTADSASRTIERFLKIVFGHNFHSPSKDEYGMYVAKSVSLRSVDLSRQVGAAIFSEQGEVKVLGCNEVPSPGGGTYWEGDQGDAREFKIGFDTNDQFKQRLLGDAIKQLVAVGVIDERYSRMTTQEFLDEVKSLAKVDLEKKLMMMDVIEYGRIIHAEMNAITDAARKGVSIEGATLFCTTFPCHLCAKHIISAGIMRVVYIEPYPKSYATELYMDDIVLERTSGARDDGKVHFEPFIGVAPFRYRDMFEKSKRKDKAGRAQEWLADRPQPDLNIRSETYPRIELDYLQLLTQRFAEQAIMLEGLSDYIVESVEGSSAPAVTGLPAAAASDAGA